MATADDLFKQFDGQIVGSGDYRRQIEVEGIREADNRFWIQLALLDDGDVIPLVINMGAAVTASAALARIERWLANPEEAKGQLIVVD
jgi:hypothetical protein